VRRFAVLLFAVGLLSYPVAAGACDRNPGAAAGLSARNALAVAHPTVKAKRQHAAMRYLGYR
jgi:hypothetical protein